MWSVEGSKSVLNIGDMEYGWFAEVVIMNKNALKIPEEHVEHGMALDVIE